MTTTEERTTKLGRCHDCAAGMLIPAESGFALYRDDEGHDQHWYCCFCGSNHVDILDEEGNTILSQGDIYP